jgi:hypothetical protein
VSSLSKNREPEAASKSSVKSRAFSAKADTRDFNVEVKSVIVIEIVSSMSIQRVSSFPSSSVVALPVTIFRQNFVNTGKYRQATHIININEHNAYN